MKKIKTVLQLAAFGITLPLLVLSGICRPPMSHPVDNQLPVIDATGFNKDESVLSQDEPLPLLLNSKIIVITY